MQLSCLTLAGLLAVYCPSILHLIPELGIRLNRLVLTYRVPGMDVTQISWIITHERHGPARPVRSKVNTNNLTRICIEDKGKKLEFAVSLKMNLAER